MFGMSCRECRFINVSTRNVDSLIEKVKLAIVEMGDLSAYDINIYKNVFACCGVDGVSLIIEVTGPEEKMESIDLKAVSKILEICEKEGLEHTLESLEVT